MSKASTKATSPRFSEIVDQVRELHRQIVALCTAPSNCEVAALPKEQEEILLHTATRAAGGYYCGNSPDMQELVRLGLMQYVGRKSFVSDDYFILSPRGKLYAQATAELRRIAEGEETRCT